MSNPKKFAGKGTCSRCTCCEVCYCGPNCQCTETLCRSEAASVLNSLAGAATDSRSRSRSPVPSHKDSSCCSSSPLNRVINDIQSKQNSYATFSDTSDKCRPKIEHTDIAVSGMTCSMCTQAIEKGISDMEGVSAVNASLAFNSVHIEFDSNQVSRIQLIEEIEDIGYAVIPEKKTSTSIVEFIVSGMTCSMCTKAVTKALESVPGVKNVVVSLSTNQAEVKYDASEVSIDALTDAIEDVGYDVVGTHAVSNQNKSSTFLNGSGDATPPSPDRIDRMLERQDEEVRNRKSAFLWSLLGTFPILIITMVLPHFEFLAPVQWLKQVIVIKSSKSGDFSIVLEALILWTLCTPIQFGCGYPFYKSSYYGLRQGVMGMDVLVAVGTTASYGYAVWATLAGSMEYHFFETSAVLICFVLLGKWMQTLAVRRTSQALTQLLKLQPKTAIQVVLPATNTHKKWNPVRNDPYKEQIVPIADIKAGDYVKILKGSSIPADGIIRFGEMTVDESMITGESTPVLKSPGAVVLGGTICAEAGQDAGASFVEVTGVGSNTALSQILQLVQDAQNRQVPIQNFADKVAGIFVPTVVLLSLATFVAWFALLKFGFIPPSYLPAGESPQTFSLLFGISCLVISCPCALGLATPTAVMVGTGVGAKQGILMKGGETLELASKVDSVVFDKTGTLTKGKPAVTDFNLVVTEGYFWEVVGSEGRSRMKTISSISSKNDFECCLLWLLGSLERNSEHLLAGAIVGYVEEKLVEFMKVDEEQMSFAQPSNFVAMTGRGASGRILGSIDVSIGNRAFCDVQGFSISKEVEDEMQRLELMGKTAIVAAVNGNIVVVMGIADELKPEASTSIVYMKEQMGIDIWMVTGDNSRTAHAIARQLKLPSNRVIAEALPAAKVGKVQELQRQGKFVAMVGDGVNDSPALVQADVGLSIGKGAEIAAEASDMVLVRGRVTDVCTALDLSRVIFQRIQLNFVWSLLYNCLSIPLAAGVFYPMFRMRLPPTVAALAMALSSLSVVASSLALHLYRPPNVETDFKGKRKSGAVKEFDIESQVPLLD